MIDARTFSLMEDRTPASTIAGRLSLSDPRSAPQNLSSNLSLFAESSEAGTPITGDPDTDAKTADALQWIGALSQLGGIVGQALAARKRKKKQSGTGYAITPEARQTAIDVPQENISQYLPGVTR
jgi:hypothetical protein